MCVSMQGPGILDALLGEDGVHKLSQAGSLVAEIPLILPASWRLGGGQKSR